MPAWSSEWSRTSASDFGGLDILVNNAGLVFRKRFSESTTEDWRKQIDTCLYGALNCCHSAGPLLEASGRGRIISIMGDSSRVGESGLALAAAARAGTIALMKSLAREWGRSGVTANSISLGLIETAHDKSWVEANREKLVKAYAIRRLGLAVRRRADGGASGVRRGQLDHRSGDQHQWRVQHGLGDTAMMDVDLIAPIATLLGRHAKSEAGAGGLFGFGAFDNVRATGEQHRGDRGKPGKGGSARGRPACDLSAERGRLDRGLLCRAQGRRCDRSDQLRCRGR